MRFASALLLWAVSSLACTGGEPASAPEPPRGVARSTAPPEPPAPPASAPAASDAPFQWPNEPPASAPAQPAEPPAKAQRDYAAELLAALGDPTSCLKPRTGRDAPTEIIVELEAHVVGAGSVSRSYVRSTQLDADETECVRKRTSSLRLRTPIDDAPRTVRATLRLAMKSAAKTGT
jgi:hypothetical protein